MILFRDIGKRSAIVCGCADNAKSADRNRLSDNQIVLRRMEPDGGCLIWARVVPDGV